MYKFIPYETIKSYLREIETQKVSIKARSPGQFIDIYKQYGCSMPEEWIVKRNNFIKRTLAAYVLNPTRRRWLSLIAWAYHA